MIEGKTNAVLEENTPISDEGSRPEMFEEHRNQIKVARNSPHKNFILF